MAAPVIQEAVSLDQAPVSKEPRTRAKPRISLASHSDNAPPANVSSSNLDSLLDGGAGTNAPLALPDLDFILDPPESGGTRVATDDELLALNLIPAAPPPPTETPQPVENKMDLQKIAQDAIDKYLKTIPAGMRKHKHLLVAGGSLATGALLNTFGISHMTPEQQQLLLHADLIMGTAAGVSSTINRAIAVIETLPAYEARAPKAWKRFINRVRKAAYWTFMVSAPYSVGASAGLILEHAFNAPPANAAEPTGQNQPVQQPDAPAPPSADAAGTTNNGADIGSQVPDGIKNPNTGNILGENPPAQTNTTPGTTIPGGNGTNVGEAPPPPPPPTHSPAGNNPGLGEAPAPAPPVVQPEHAIPSSVTLGGRGMWGAAEDITSSFTTGLSHGAANIIRDAVKDQLVAHFPGDFQAGHVLQIPHGINVAAGQHTINMGQTIIHLVEQVQKIQHVDTQTALNILYENHSLEQQLTASDLPKLLEQGTALAGGH